MTRLHQVEIVSVNVGLPALLGQYHEKDVISGIHKHPVTSPTIRVTANGLEGDGQADLRVHGDKLKKVYAYPAEHYVEWRDVLNRQLHPGIFGENFTVRGTIEADVTIGDRWTIGGVILEVTKPRTPCYKIDVHLGLGTAKLMQQNGRCGWYFRVVRGGIIVLGSTIPVITTRGLSIAELFAEKMRTSDAVPGPSQG